MDEEREGGLESEDGKVGKGWWKKREIETASIGWWWWIERPCVAALLTNDIVKKESMR